MKLLQHDAGKIFPRLSKEAYESLKTSIKTHGLLNDIWLYEGKVVSGWERYNACLDVGKEPRFKEFTNTTISAYEFVWAENGERRHLKKKDLIRIGAILTEQLRIERKNGNLTSSFDKNGRWKSTAGKAAEMVGIGESTINRAHTIMKQRPDLFKEVSEGKISVGKAYPIVRNKNQFVGCGKKHMSDIDRRARKILAEHEIKTFKFPSSIYASDSEIWALDTYMASQGYSLSLNRVGSMFNAIYTKTTEKLDGGYPTFKAAIFGAGKEVFSKIESTK